MSWIQTYKGNIVYYDIGHIAESQIDIEDIAHSLSLQTRYNGHCKKIMSVAEHCIHACRKARPDQRIHALLHDAPEAYIGDIVRPLKPFLGKYLECIESRFFQLIYSKYHLNLNEIDRSYIKLIDLTMLMTEKDQVMNGPVNWPCPDLDKYNDVIIEFYKPEIAEKLYLQMFDELLAQKMSSENIKK